MFNVLGSAQEPQNFLPFPTNLPLRPVPGFVVGVLPEVVVVLVLVGGGVYVVVDDGGLDPGWHLIEVVSYSSLLELGNYTYW
jgi:hypothetical protein